MLINDRPYVNHYKIKLRIDILDSIYTEHDIVMTMLCYPFEKKSFCKLNFEIPIKVFF